MSEKRTKIKRWIHRGRFAVEVEVEAVFPADSPNEPCLEPATIRLLDEIVRRAEAGDLQYLKQVGKVFQAIPA